MVNAQKIWDFPNVPIESQLFHVPGSAFDGGITSGGARILSPEPGGFSVLETQVAFNPNEWDFPFSSWLMSKMNGEIFRIKLTKTPQLARINFNSLLQNSVIQNNKTVKWNNQQNWNNDKPWLQEGLVVDANEISLEGSTKIKIDASLIGQSLKYGNIIGIGDSSYLVDEINYENDIAEITVRPPLRKSVFKGELIFIEISYFLGTISNGNQIRNSYQNSNNGGIQIGNIIFNEVVL